MTALQVALIDALTEPLFLTVLTFLGIFAAIVIVVELEAKQEYDWPSRELQTVPTHPHLTKVEQTGRTTVPSVGDCGGVVIELGERSDDEARETTHGLVPDLLRDLDKTHRDPAPDGFLFEVTFTDYTVERSIAQGQTRYVIVSNDAVEKLQRNSPGTAENVSDVLESDFKSEAWLMSHPAKTTSGGVGGGGDGAAGAAGAGAAAGC